MESIEKNIGEDLARVGATLEETRTARKWDYFPHVDSKALDDHFYVKLGELQGKNDTSAIGAAHTFDIIPHVKRQAEAIVAQLVDGSLPGVGVHTAPVEAPERRVA